MMPGEGFEPPTFGLQNRCTTTVLTRQINNPRAMTQPLLPNFLLNGLRRVARSSQPFIVTGC
jgi:hypothetical protein